ncbi:MAG: zinc ABC transporter substrate-binding protein [Rhizobiaceae bacterium]
MTVKFFFQFFLAAIFMMAPASSKAVANDISVSTKSLHSLVAGITGNNARANLIIDGVTSIHHMSLKPSTIRKLHTAKLIVWMGAGIEPFIENALNAVADTTTIHDLSPHLITQNVYWWTNPAQAIALIAPLTELIIATDPKNKSQYEKNAKNLLLQLNSMILEIKASLAPFSDTHFMTLHDTYRGFNSNFGLQNGKAIERNSAVGAKTLTKLRKEIRRTNVACVFGEVGENPAILNTLLEGTSTKVETLDAMGNKLVAGPQFYEDLIRQIADTYLTCFRTK